MQATNLKLAKLRMLGDIVAFDARTDQVIFWVRVTDKVIERTEKLLAKHGYYTTQIRDNRIWI